MNAEKLVQRKWRLLTATMDERARRLWAGAEADALGWGKVAADAATKQCIRNWCQPRKARRPCDSRDPESPLRWTNKSTHALSAEMFSHYGIRVGDKTVARLLRKSGYSLQAPSKTVEGKQHPDRNAQFEHINARAKGCLKRGVPFISIADVHELGDERAARRACRIARCCASWNHPLGLGQQRRASRIRISTATSGPT